MNPVRIMAIALIAGFSFAGCGPYVDINAEYFEFDSETRTITGYSDNAPKNVIIPSIIKDIKVEKIGDNAFRNKGLTSVDNFTNISSIGESAFKKNLLQTVFIPNNVLIIGSEAFAENYLTDITISGSDTIIEKDAFTGNYLTSITMGPNNKYAANITINFGKFYNDNGKEPGTYIKNIDNTWTKQKGLGTGD